MGRVEPRGRDRGDRTKLRGEYGVPESLARRDVDATLASWSQCLLSSASGNGSRHGTCPSVPDRFGSNSSLVEINCVLNGRGFRVLLEPGDLVEEIAPRLAQVGCSVSTSGRARITFALVNGEDRVFVFRDEVCIAEEEKTSGARAILLQEMTSHCDPDRETRAVLHAGACGTASGCVILAGNPTQVRARCVRP